MSRASTSSPYAASDSYCVDEEGADFGSGAGVVVDQLELGVGTEAAAGEVDVVQLGGDLVDRGREAGRVSDQDHAAGAEGAEVVAIAHHEPPDDTRPLPELDRIEYDGDCSWLLR